MLLFPVILNALPSLARPHSWGHYDFEGPFDLE